MDAEQGRFCAYAAIAVGIAWKNDLTAKLHGKRKHMKTYLTQDPKIVNINASIIIHKPR